MSNEEESKTFPQCRKLQSGAWKGTSPHPKLVRVRELLLGSGGNQPTQNHLLAATLLTFGDRGG